MRIEGAAAAPYGEERVRAAFLRQAEACAELGSPFTARLCTLAGRRLDGATEVGRTILEWQGDASGKGDAVPLRLAGGLHALVIAGRSRGLAAVYPPHDAEVSDEVLWRATESALRDHSDHLLAWLRSAPQTNEVRRSAVLLPGFLTIARLTGLPITLSEIGASAGLNLRWDRYRYRLGTVTWGDPSSPVALAPDWTGESVEAGNIEVIDRAGCDLNPLDPASAEDRIRSLSYIWADQTDRLERTRAAFEIATGIPASVEKADAVEWLDRRLAKRRAGAVHVLFHTIVWQYLPMDARKAGEALIAEAGRSAGSDRPLAWLRLEHDGRAPGAALTLTLWPDGEERQIARADFHGRWIDWVGWDTARRL